MRRLAILVFVMVSACERGDEAERSAVADSLAGGEIALPPSARAPRAPQPGGAPDTVVPAAPDDTIASESTVGPVPPPVLDVGAIVNSYRHFYEKGFAEMGSQVRGDVDPELVEEAKHRTALEFGYVDANAWNELLAELTPGQRAEVAQGIATTNRDLARMLHGGSPPRGSGG
jgi:hypothetical protein